MTETVSTYERLEPHEVDAVRAYRRQLWAELAATTPESARRQVVDALRKHSDPWVDGVNLVTLISVALKGKTIGDLNPAQRYSLMTLLEEVSA